MPPRIGDVPTDRPTDVQWKVLNLMAETANPMWTDELDVLPVASLLEGDELKRLAVVGATIRIVTRRGTVHEGPVTRVTSGYGGLVIIVVNGLTFDSYQHDFYLITGDRAHVRTPGRAEFTAEQVRDIVADLSAESGRPTVVTAKDIIRSVLGFSPGFHLPAPDRGGKTEDAWTRQFADNAGLTRILKQLASDGVLRAVTQGTHANKSADPRYVYFPFRTRSGYVLAASYDEAVAVARDEKRAQKAKELRREAQIIVAERHEAEVEQVLRELLKTVQ